MKTRLIALLVLAAVPAPAEPHAQTANPRFEVASIKVHPPGNTRSVVDDGAPDRFTATNASIEQLASYAYEIPPGLLSGVPSSMGAFRFDVNAKVDGTATPGQKRDMVKALLGDRFKLKLRRDTKDGDVYALVLARADRRLGPNLHPASAECARVVEAIARSETTAAPPPDPAARLQCYAETGGPNAPAGWHVKGMTMARLATRLRDRSLQPVVDRTGLSGPFDFDMRSTLVGLDPRIGTIRPMPPDTPETAPSILTALPEQLGLKLERQRGPIETFVVEHVELPTPD